MDEACATGTVVTNGTPYDYTVVAKNDTGSSAASTEVMATPYSAPTGLAGVGGNQMNLLTWSAVSGASGGGYIVSRSTTSGGPYTQISGTPINGTAYLDTDHGAGLAAGTTYYYIVKYLDANYESSPQSAELAVATVTASNGWWGIGISATGTSPGSTPASSAAYAVGTNMNTSVTAAAGVVGAQTAGSTQTATSTCSGTWTATFVGSTSTTWPQLYVLDEIQANSADATVSGAYSGSVYTPTSTLIATENPSTVAALPGTPVTTSSIDTTTDRGDILFTYERTTDTLTPTLTPTLDGTTIISYVESKNDTRHIVHIFTPAYFRAHFTDPTQITLSFASSAGLTATATLPAGAPSSADCELSGSVSDTFTNYTVGG